MTKDQANCIGFAWGYTRAYGEFCGAEVYRSDIARFLGESRAREVRRTLRKLSRDEYERLLAGTALTDLEEAPPSDLLHAITRRVPAKQRSQLLDAFKSGMRRGVTVGARDCTEQVSWRPIEVVEEEDYGSWVRGRFK
jgi:integrase